ncbi:hypothetical protein ACVXG7_32095 [Enterobacter hormaechei]
MGISRNLVGVEFDEDNQLLFTRVNARRVSITSCRDSLKWLPERTVFTALNPSAWYGRRRTGGRQPTALFPGLHAMK